MKTNIKSVPFLFDKSRANKKEGYTMAISKNGKWSLQEIFNNLVDLTQECDRSWVKENGFVLTLSLSGPEQKSSSTGGTTVTVNNGFITKSGKAGIQTPFLTSWRGWGIQPNSEGKIELTEFDDISRNLESHNSELHGIPINWKFNLSAPLIREMLGIEKTTVQGEGNLWRKFYEYVTARKKLQIQMMVVKSADSSKGVGELKTIPLANGKTTQAFTVFISKPEIYAIKLVSPGDDYIHKVDRPSSVMDRMKGRVVEESNDYVNKVKVTDHLKRRLEIEEEETVIESSRELDLNNFESNIKIEYIDAEIQSLFNELTEEESDLDNM
jgi:hypothetical protein